VVEDVASLDVHGQGRIVGDWDGGPGEGLFLQERLTSGTSTSA
jgi:hypothetical protein